MPNHPYAIFHTLVSVVSSFALLAISTIAVASTLNQNTSWTIDRPNTTTRYQVVAYGDSIYAGYSGSLFSASRYSAPTVDAEYLSARWNADIVSVRRAKSGAVASDVYNSKIVADKSFMQNSATRMVTFEMCGNDSLQARSSFRAQRGTCNYDVLETAVKNCKTYVASSMDFINANAFSGVKYKVITNLYYPGYNADNTLSSCNDRATGARVNIRDALLPILARINFAMCDLARQKGFQCNDSFAQYMGADYDSNNDGKIDSDALKYIAGESESSYVTRITSTLRSTLRDANTHFATASTSFDYLQSDDTHPTFTGGTVRAGLFGGSSGSGAPRYDSFTNGKSPIWNRYGHERMGWGLSVFAPPSPF